MNSHWISNVVTPSSQCVAKLTASHIVRFLGYGGAMVMFGLAARRLMIILGGKEEHAKALRCVLLALSGLIIAATLAAAVWLMVETVRQSRAISERVAVAMAGKGRGESDPQR